MTRVVFAYPRNGQPSIQVFGLYQGDDDRYVFGVKEFTPDREGDAESYARRLMERSGADHFERVRR